MIPEEEREIPEASKFVTASSKQVIQGRTIW